ncbi:MAG: LPS export ABC transporter periplasmic protein LptC [Firmicutes bacterium]|nr:LPS export ABC transporter periplasmic protein LptC [Bacillota bacterium]
MIAPKEARGALATTVFWAVMTLFLVGFAGVGAAQKADDNAKKVTRGNIKVIGAPPGQTSGRIDFKTRVWVFQPSSGYVQIVYQDTTVVAKKVEFYEEQQRAVLSGEVKVTFPDAELSADKAVAEFRQDRFAFEENVKFVQYEVKTSGTKAAPKTEKKLLRTLTSERMEYGSATRDMTARGKVSVIETDRKITADELTYRDKEQEMVLSGSVRVETKESTLRVPRMRIDLKDDVAELFGAWESDFVIEGKEAQ